MVISFEEKKRQIEQERQKEEKKQAKRQQIPKENIKLTKKQKQKARKRARRNLAIGGILAALGITGLTIVGTKLLPEGEPKTPVDVEQENNNQDRTNEFKDKYKVNENELIQSESEVVKEVKELQNADDVLAYLKNMYIEKYEEKTGDETLTTNDIKIIQSLQNYVYIDNETGDIITHGELPEETEKVLAQDNVSYDIEYDLETYQVQNSDGQTIDMITMENIDGQTTPIKVIPGNQYNKMKDYDSVLDEMGSIIPEGIYYMDHLEDENARNEFISAIEKVQKQQEVQNKQIEDDEMGLE